jgi:hypothetical protein
MSLKTPNAQYKEAFMLAVHPSGSNGSKAYVRRFIGFVMAITACGVFAEAYGILPDPRRLPQKLVFGVIGLFWGWLVVGRDASPARLRKAAGRDVLHFSAIGVVGFAVEVFSNLDNAPAFYAALSNMGWTIFSGLFVWSLCLAATIKDVAPRNGQGSSVKGGSLLVDPWWYVGHSVAIVICIGLVLRALNQTSS